MSLGLISLFSSLGYFEVEWASMTATGVWVLGVVPGRTCAALPALRSLRTAGKPAPPASTPASLPAPRLPPGWCNASQWLASAWRPR